VIQNRGLSRRKDTRASDENTPDDSAEIMAEWEDITQEILNENAPDNTPEILTADSDNWLYFFQEQKDEPKIQFARRFVIIKSDGTATNDFFENYGENPGNGTESIPLFVHNGEVYYIVENAGNLGVLHQDLAARTVSGDFSPYDDGVTFEIPSDEIIARTQAAVDVFSDMLPDFNNNFGKYVKIAVRIANDGEYYARSLYSMTSKAVSNYVKDGKILPLNKPQEI